MDYAAAIQRVFEHVENDEVEKAAMVCLRLARSLRDYFHTAIFLKTVTSGGKNAIGEFFNDTPQLDEKQRRFIFEAASRVWLQDHQLRYKLSVVADDEDDGEGSVITL